MRAVSSEAVVLDWSGSGNLTLALQEPFSQFLTVAGFAQQILSQKTLQLYGSPSVQRLCFCGNQWRYQPDLEHVCNVSSPLSLFKLTHCAQTQHKTFSFYFIWLILTTMFYHTFSQSNQFADKTEIKLLHETKSMTEN